MIKYNIIHVHHGTIADEETNFTLLDLCNLHNLNPEFIIEMVNEGILEPKGDRKVTWRFSNDEVECVRKVMRFKNDLNINLAGAALALELLERIDRLEALLERGL